MRDLSFLKDYYENYDEEGRLISKHGQVEYITTMHYIHKYLQKGAKILEVGAGTGRYSLALAEEGYEVEAVELIEHNVEAFKSKIKSNNVRISKGDALDLSRFEEESFEVTLVLGPMYHLYTHEEKVKALGEALRVTKRGGHVFIAYCMNEATMLTYCFAKNAIHECLEKNMLTEDFHCLSKPQDLFELVRVEDIDKINADFKVERLHLVATDGPTNYLRELIDGMDDITFDLYLRYHLATCHRQDLIGATHHSLDVLKKL